MRIRSRKIKVILSYMKRPKKDRWEREREMERDRRWGWGVPLTSSMLHGWEKSHRLERPCTQGAGQGARLVLYS